MFRITMLKTILLSLLFLPFASYALGEKAEKSDTKCKEKPKEEHFAALGFELGMCKWKVEKIVKKHGKSLKESEPLVFESKLDYPKNLKTFETDYVDAVPPLKDKLMFENYTKLKFRDDVLYKVSKSFLYDLRSDSKSLQDSFNAIDSILTNKFGSGSKEHSEGIKDRIKIWTVSNNIIVMSTMTSLSALEISYEDSVISNLADKETKEYREKRREEQLKNVKGF